MLIKVRLCGSAWHGSQRCVRDYFILFFTQVPLGWGRVEGEGTPDKHEGPFFKEMLQKKIHKKSCTCTCTTKSIKVHCNGCFQTPSEKVNGRSEIGRQNIFPVSFGFTLKKQQQQ